MNLTFVVYIFSLLFFFVLVGIVIHIKHKIKEARLFGKDISNKNKIYSLVAKYFIKDMP